MQEQPVLPTPSLPPTGTPPINQNEQEKDTSVNETSSQEQTTPQDHSTKKEEFQDIIKQTTVPTSTPEIPLSTENVTEVPKAKSLGILKGFWRFHQGLAEGVLYYGQPVKGAVRGTLGFIGLGKVRYSITLLMLARYQAAIST